MSRAKVVAIRPAFEQLSKKQLTDLAEEVQELLVDAMAVLKVSSMSLGREEISDSAHQGNFENDLIRVFSVIDATMDKAWSKVGEIAEGLHSQQVAS